MVVNMARIILITGLWLAVSALQGTPIITAGPTSEIVTLGETVQFQVTATGIAPLVYQWRCNGTNLPSAGVISTVAGRGTNIYAGNGVYGDGGLATNAILRGPFFLTSDASGNLFISDTFASRVRKVDTNGIITTIPNTNSYDFNTPSGITVDATGNLIVAQFVQSAGAIREVFTNNTVSTIATNIHWNNPNGVTVDASGNLYVADTGNYCVREIRPDGSVETVAGRNTFGYSGDGGPATNAHFCAPNGIAVDPRGTLYIADWIANNVRKVDTNGIITTFAGNGTTNYSGDGGPALEAGLYGPRDVKLDSSGSLYITDFGHNCVRKVDTNGIITTVVGNGTSGYSGDGGDALDAGLHSPTGVTLDARGNMFFTDYGNNCIRKVAFTGLPNLNVHHAGMENAGGYSVVVSDSSGSVTSSVVSLAVWQPQFSTSTAQSGAQFKLSGQAGNAYVLQTTTNLAPPVIWNSVVTNMAGSNGQCSFTDTNANTRPATFYRISLP